MINLDRNQEAGVSCLMHAACARIRLVWGEAGFFERTRSRLRELWDMLAKMNSSVVPTGYWTDWKQNRTMK
jgi:IS1 family transposase